MRAPRVVLLVLAAACSPPGAPLDDAYTAAPADVWEPPPVDAHVAPPIDAGVPPVDGAAAIDVAVTPTKQYLDRCASPAECVSGLCVEDVGGSHFCSRTCTSHGGCASEHVCNGAGVCVPDDTGGPCSTATPEACALGMCLGPSGGTGACTRDCATALDCPSGYACTLVSGVKICVDIERPCAGAADCGSGLCLTNVGCTATCTTASDCPPRLTSLGVASYTCATLTGAPGTICIPPADIIGDDPIGAVCQWDSTTGYSLCRSAACDDSAPSGPMCTQACGAQGGCAPGLGCYPLVVGSDILMTCQRAGSGDLGDACAGGSACYSGLCDGTGVCTRLCSDGICPTGWTCDVIAGYSIWICRP
jgi:hypothetical protein